MMMLLSISWLNFLSTKSETFKAWSKWNWWVFGAGDFACSVTSNCLGNVRITVKRWQDVHDKRAEEYRIQKRFIKFIVTKHKVKSYFIHAQHTSDHPAKLMYKYHQSWAVQDLSSFLFPSSWCGHFWVNNNSAKWDDHDCIHCLSLIRNIFAWLTVKHSTSVTPRSKYSLQWRHELYFMIINVNGITASRPFLSFFGCSSSSPLAATWKSQ